MSAVPLNFGLPDSSTSRVRLTQSLITTAEDCASSTDPSTQSTSRSVKDSCTPPEQGSREPRVPEPGEEGQEYSSIWNIYNEEATKSDTSMVEGFHREIDVLLVFTGLFSAVLTTFIIQAYQMILPDPAEETSLILRKLGNLTVQLATPRLIMNNRSSLPLPEQGAGDVEPSNPQIQWVNGLWFAALACSLSAALVSMLAKQWLYAYTRRISGSPRDRARKRQHRFIQFRLWRVLTVISCLPFLLHAALFLFFGGLVVLLWRGELMAISVATVIVVALAYIFYFGSMWISLISPDCPYQHPISTHIHDWLKPSKDWYKPYSESQTSSCLEMENLVFTEGSRGKDQHPASHAPEQDMSPTHEDTLDAAALIWLLKESVGTEAVRCSALQAIAALPRDFTAYKLLRQAGAIEMILQRFESCFILDTSVATHWEIRDPQAAEEYCRAWMRLTYQTRDRWPIRLIRPLEILRDDASQPKIRATATCALALTLPDRYSTQKDLLSLLSHHVDGRVNLSWSTQQLVLDTLLECIAHWELSAAVIANIVSQAVPVLVCMLHSLASYSPYTLREAASLNLYALTGHFVEEEVRRSGARRRVMYWEASLEALCDVVQYRAGYGIEEDRLMDMVALGLAQLANVLVTNSKAFSVSLHKSVKSALTALFVESRITLGKIQDSDTMANIFHLLHPPTLSDPEQEIGFTKHLIDTLKQTRHPSVLSNALRVLDSHLASYSTLIMETFLDGGGMDILLHIANTGNIDGRKPQMDSLRALCTFVETSATLQLEDGDFSPSFFDSIFRSSFLKTLCTVLNAGRWWIPDVAEVWLPALVKLCRVRSDDPGWRKLEQSLWRYASLYRSEYRRSDLVDKLNRIRDLRRQLEGGAGISFFEEDF